MLIYFLEWFRDHVWDFPGSGLINFITFRAGMATILSLIIYLLVDLIYFAIDPRIRG